MKAAETERIENNTLFSHSIPNALVDGGPTILAGGRVGGVPFGIISGVDQRERLPQEFGFRLTEAFPNPFNPATQLSYTIPKRSHVRIEIISLLGRAVALLLDTELDPGTYTVSWDASECASGIYFCQLRAREFMATRRLLFVK